MAHNCTNLVTPSLHLQPSPQLLRPILFSTPSPATKALYRFSLLPYCVVRGCLGPSPTAPNHCSVPLLVAPPLRLLLLLRRPNSRSKPVLAAVPSCFPLSPPRFPRPATALHPTPYIVLVLLFPLSPLAAPSFCTVSISVAPMLCLVPSPSGATPSLHQFTFLFRSFDFSVEEKSAVQCGT